MARQNLMTVVSEVPQVWASSVMVELATPSGSSITRCATRRSAGGSDGSSDRTRTTVLSGGVVLGEAGVSPPPRTVAKAVPIGSPSPESCPAGFLMQESFLRGTYRVNLERVYGHDVLTHLAGPFVVGID